MCPVCRCAVAFPAVRSVILDSAVEKIMESMDAETKKKRAQLVQERDEENLLSDEH